LTNEKYDGIRSALKYAMLTDQSVNVSLNTALEGVKIEGIIKEVQEHSFSIQNRETNKLENYGLSKVEYVEYS
jgi:uncharacterized protein YfeS